ncbi:MAG: phosphodiester glycosidase family protein [Bacilli bacterium]
MKKIILFLSLFFCLFVFNSQLLIFGENEVTEIAGASVYNEEVVETNHLPYGVTHTLTKSFTSTSITGYDADGLGGGTATVEPGTFYPQQINVLEVPSSQELRITNWGNFNGNRWTLTTVKGLISDYESKHPGWKVVAAINGDFFDIGGKGNLPYQTNGAVTSFGENYKTTSGGTVAFTNDGSINSLVGNQPVQRTDKMLLSIYNENNEVISEFSIDNVNVNPSLGQTSLFYANYDTTHTIVPKEVTIPSGFNGYFVDQAILTLPNSESDFYGKGLISSETAKTLGSGQFAIVTDNETIKQKLTVGTLIRVQYEFIGAYANIDDVAGCGQTIMASGTVNPEGLTDRAPRTVVGRKADGTIVMMVIDGRQSSKGMYGADRTELAAIMHMYGAVDAYNLDGGGSSTMVVRKNGSFVVMNSPSDGRERTDANCLLIIARDPELEINIQERTQSNLTFNVNILANNGHDIQKLFIEMNGETKEIVNNQVMFSELLNNNEYFYRMFYQDTQGEQNLIIQDGKFKTLKILPQYLGIEVYETEESFRIKLLYNDIDNAGNFGAANVGINGKTTFLKNGEITLKKSIIGNELSALKITFFYDLNDGNKVLTSLENPEYTSFISLGVYFYDIISCQQVLINDLYQ